MQEMKLHPATDSFTRDLLHIQKDEPGVGNGSHHYEVYAESKDGASFNVLSLQFQHGPRLEVGVNGVVTGTLLQILIDHLQGFQSGEYRNRETACAITHLEEALFWLKSRELEREQRGVLGKAAK
jgi:hypothetical protein